MRRLSVALLFAAVGLTACNEDLLTTRTPVLFAADTQALPPMRDGVWIDADACGSADTGQDLPKWSDCGGGFIVRRGTPAHPESMVENDPAIMRGPRLAVTHDFQIGQQGPGDPGSDGYYSYRGIDGIVLDETGRVVALNTWRLKCGPPPPDGSRTEGGKPRYQTLEPYPGVVVEEGGCAAKGRAGLVAAASASRVDPKGEHGKGHSWRWVREERPADWAEAQPVEPARS